MMQPQNGIIKDKDGKLYSLIDLLQGNKTPLDPQTLEVTMQPANAIIVDKDSKLYSLVELIGSSSGGGNPDDIEKLKTDVAQLKTTMESVPEGRSIVTKTNVEELENAKVIKEYVVGTHYKRGDFIKGPTLDVSSDIFVTIDEDFTATESTLEGQVNITGGNKLMTLDPTITGSSYGVNKEYVTEEWNALSTPLITRISNIENELSGVSTKLDTIINNI